jgi:hypothetical protein
MKVMLVPALAIQALETLIAANSKAARKAKVRLMA